MEENQLKFCKDILNRIRRSTYSTPFKEPVDPEKLGCHDYFDIVKNPMDISTIKNLLYENKYATAEHFRDDFKLMIENCFLYNAKDSHVHKCGAEINKLFDNLYFAMPMEGKKIKMDPGMEDCGRLLEEMLKTKYRKTTWPFLQPVSAESVPDYYDVIKSPMDLSTVQTKLINNGYKKKDEFYADLDLMLKNCFAYNAEGTEVFQCGLELKNLIANFGVADSEIHGQISALKAKISSAEREIEALMSKLENTKNYSVGDRVEIAKKIESADDSLVPLIVRIVQKYKKDIDTTQDEIEVDLKCLPNRAIDEIAKLLGVI